MAISKAERNRQKAPAVARYQAKTYGKYTFRYRLSGDDGVTMDLVRAAADVSGMSVNAWIVEAIRQRLERESRADAADGPAAAPTAGSSTDTT